jgi:hypothetical protein
MLMEADLPENIDALRALVLEQSRMLAQERAAAADLAVAKSEADAEVERLQSIITAFMRHRFGSRSEQLDPDQLQLGLEDVETALGHARAAREAMSDRPANERPRKTNRGALPAHLERIEQVVDIDNLFDPLEMGRQCAAVGLAWPLVGGTVRHRFAGRSRVPQRRLDVFQAELELIGIELLGAGPKTVAHERCDDRLEPLDLGIGLALGDRQIGRRGAFLRQHPGLLEDQCAERIDVLGKVRLHEHDESESGAEGLVNQQSAGLADAARHARGASPDPRAARRVAPLSAVSHRPGCPAI